MTVPADLQNLVAMVPRPPGEAILHGVRDQDLAEFEARTGVKIGSQLAEWLKFTNGPCIGPGGFCGIAPKRRNLDFEEMFRLFPEWRLQGSVPVAGDGVGNYFLLARAGRFGAGEPVLFFDHEQEGLSSAQYLVASDLWHFIRFILREEMGDRGWPFTREKVTTDDPGIHAYAGIPLPWET